MTQPCHKDTALNQQCCDSKHNAWKGGEKDRRDNARGARAMQGAGPNPNTGQHSTHPPPFNTATGQTERGRQHTDRGRPHSTGSPATRPPFTHHATHHHSMPPPFCDGPPPPPRRGGSAQRIPHHTNTTDTHSPPTHHTPGNGTVCDMNAVLMSTAVG